MSKLICCGRYARHKWIGNTCCQCSIGWEYYAEDRLKEADKLEAENTELKAEIERLKTGHQATRTQFSRVCNSLVPEVRQARQDAVKLWELAIT